MLLPYIQRRERNSGKWRRWNSQEGGGSSFPGWEEEEEEEEGGEKEEEPTALGLWLEVAATGLSGEGTRIHR